MAAEVLRKYTEVRLTLTDYDDDMVDIARHLLAAFGDRAHAKRADATRLPFPDGSFDVVLSFIMLHHVIDWETALAEAARVLRPGGRLIGYDLLATTPMHLLHRVERSRHRMMHLDELRETLRRLPVLGRTAKSIGGLTVRFDIEKRPALNRRGVT
jgi:ubiquinone/menaquinone biosynthesis C-methylase UbiE